MPRHRPKTFVDGIEATNRRSQSLPRDSQAIKPLEGSQSSEPDMPPSAPRSMATHDEPLTLFDQANQSELMKADQVKSPERHESNIADQSRASYSPRPSLLYTALQRQPAQAAELLEANRAPPAPTNFQDYQLQLMLLEQENTKRFMMARAKQDSILRRQQEEQTENMKAEPLLSPSPSPSPSPMPSSSSPPQAPKVPEKPAMALGVVFAPLQENDIQLVILEYQKRKRLMMGMEPREGEDVDDLTAYHVFVQMHPTVQAEVRRRLAKEEMTVRESAAEEQDAQEEAAEKYLSGDDLDMQLRLIEQNNKERLMQAREEYRKLQREEETRKREGIERDDEEHAEGFIATFPLDKQHQGAYEDQKLEGQSLPPPYRLLQMHYQKPIKHIQEKERFEILGKQTMQREQSHQDQQDDEINEEPSSLPAIAGSPHFHQKSFFERIQEQKGLEMEKSHAKQRAQERLQRTPTPFPMPHKTSNSSRYPFQNWINQNPIDEDIKAVDSDDTLEACDDARDTPEPTEQPSSPERRAQSPNPMRLGEKFASLGRDQEGLEAVQTPWMVDDSMDIDRPDEKPTNHTITTSNTIPFLPDGPKIIITTITTVTTVTTTIDPANITAANTTVKTTTTTRTTGTPAAQENSNGSGA
jgi:hypothetical protein